MRDYPCSAAGVEGSEFSRDPSISSDGRFVAFESAASELVPGDTNGVPDVFLFERVSGALERVSVDAAGAQAGGRSRFAALSAFGLLLSVCVQAMLHVQVVTGLAPPKGMTLPFISDGGTSLVISSLAVGLALGAARESAASEPAAEGVADA